MFESDGNLKAGLHEWTFEEIKDRLVDKFPTSTTRPPIMAGYEQLRSEMTVLKLEVEQWLDGSYVTSKEDPSDLDLLNFIEEDVVNTLALHQQHDLYKLVNGKATQATYRCDSYYVFTVPDGHPNSEFCRQQRKYWMGEFGYDRKDRPKGIIKTYLKNTPPPADPQQGSS
jgi:hypothetical protein